tara:strand:- start:1835 stop:11044 length:9210 start_codon:yes stop_codon:yes gene_type:complete
MYKYRIGEKEVVFNSPEEREKGLAEAEAAGLTIELIYDHSEETGDGSFNIKDDWETDDFTTGKDLDKVFQTDAAEGADVVSETTAQDTGLPSEDGSSELPLAEKVWEGYEDFKAFTARKKVEELLSETPETLAAEKRDIELREQDKPIEPIFSKSGNIINKPKKTDAQKEQEYQKELQSLQGAEAINFANQFLNKDNSKTFNPLVAESDVVGTTIAEMEKSGDLVGATVDYMKDQLGVTFFNDQNISTETLEDIARVQIQKVKNKESIKKREEQAEILKQNNVSSFDIYENNLNNQITYVSNNLDDLEKEVTNNKKEMMLIKKTRPSDGNVEAIISYGNNLANATEKWENSLKKLKGDQAVMAFDPYTHERLTASAARALEAQGVEPIDLSGGYTTLADQLPGTYEGVKAAWISNVNESSNLDDSLQSKPDFKTKGMASWSSFIQGGLIGTENMSLGNMVTLRAEGGDFSGVTPLDDSTLKTGEDLNKYLDNIISRRKYLNLNQAVLNDMFLFNNDYSDPNEKDSYGTEASQFLKIMGGGLIGDANLEEKLNDLGVQNFTSREKLDQAITTLPELGFELNETQEKNLDRTFGMEATEMTGGLAGASLSFFAGNKILGAAKFLKVANASGKGYKYVSLADKAKTLLKSNSTIAKAQGVLLTGIKEEALMQTAFQGEALKGQGFGWGIGGLAGRGAFSMLPKFSGRFWGLNGVGQHISGGITGGFTAHPFSMFTESLYQGIVKDKKFKTVLEESFIRDANGNDVDLLRDSLVSALGFTVFGFKDIKKSTVKNLFTSVTKVRELNQKYEQDLLEMKITKGITPENYKEKLNGTLLKTYETTLNDFVTSKFNLQIAEGFLGESAMNDLKYSADRAEAYLTSTPEQRAKSTEFSSREEALNVQDAFNSRLQKLNSMANAEFENFKRARNKAGDKSVDKYEIKIVDNTTDNGAYKNIRANLTDNILRVNTSNLNAGTIKHEFNHLLLATLSKAEGAPVKLKSTIEATVDRAMRNANKLFFYEGKTYKSFAEYIDKVHEGKSDDYKANEYISYLVENLKTDASFRKALIDGGALSAMKAGVTKYATLLNLSDKVGNFAFTNKSGVVDAPVSASEILQFYDSFANGGKTVSSYKQSTKAYEQLLGNIAVMPDGKTVNKHLGTEVVSLEEGVRRSFDSKLIKAETEKFKNENLAKINKEYRDLLDKNEEIDMIGVVIGNKFRSIAEKTMQSYLVDKNLNIPSETKSDIIADLIFIEGIPKAVKAYTEGQRFIDYVKENNLSKEDAAVEFKNRNLRETSGTERFNRLYGMAKGQVKEATITSYILGNLTKQLINVFQMPKYKNIFKDVSLEVDKVDRLQQQGDLPPSEAVSVDISSPLLTPRRSRLTAQTKLDLSEKTVNKLEKTVDDIFASEKLEDLDAKTIGTIELGSAGKIKLVFPKDTNRAIVEYSDGKKEIMLGARSPKPIIAKIIKKLKSEAFARLRKPGASEAEKIKAQEEFDVYSNLTTKPPKLNKQKIFKDMLRSKVSKAIYEEISEDAGEAGTPEYEAFVDKAFDLFKNNISQRTVNKRFPEFKEPLLGPDGKQIREKTAAGAPLFIKKSVTKAEWRKYFGEGTFQNVRRTSLLEALSEELGFDRTFEIIMESETRKQVESGQQKLGVDLIESYVAVIGKNIDRGIANGGMDSKYIDQASELLGITKEAGKKLYAEGMAMARDKKSYVEFDPEVAEMIETTVTLDYNAKQKLDRIIRRKNPLPQLGLGKPLVLTDKVSETTFEANLRNIEGFTEKEFMELAPTIKEFVDLLGGTIKSLTTTKGSKLDKILGELMGVAVGRNFKEGEQATRVLYNKITKGPATENPIELSNASKKAIANFESILKQNIEFEGSLNVEKALKDGKILNTILANQYRLFAKHSEIDKKLELTQEQKIQELDAFRNTREGKAAVLDIALSDALLETILAVAGDMYLKADTVPKQIKVAEMLGMMLLNNDQIGLRSLSSKSLLNFNKEMMWMSQKNFFKSKDPSPKDEGANEHVLAKQKFGLKIMDLLRSGKLNDLNEIRNITAGYESLISSADKQLAGDIFGNTTELFNRYTKVIIATTAKRIEFPLQRIKENIQFVQLAFGERNKKINPNAKRVNDAIEGAISKESLESLKTTYDFVRGQTMYDTYIQNELMSNQENFTVNKSAVFKNNKLLRASGVDISKEFMGTGQQLVETINLSKGFDSKANKERLKIEDEKTGEVRFEGDKEYKTRMEELEATSPELFLPKELAGMIERKDGAKAEDEISDSKAFMEGKKRWDDFFLPSNSEDLQGLLYKVYGKGKQGEKDMAFMKEHILRPLTKAENDLSVYRMNLVVDYKALEAEMKKLGDNKAERAAVKRVEKLGYNIDQAVRVYIWNRLGETIPGISEVEVAQLAGAVHNSPRLQAYAKGIMNITKTSQQYPKPTTNWFRSNVQYDLFTYATDGVRADFLAPWQANVDAMFDKQNLNKLEARFGGEYVKNLKQMLKRIERGKSRPESTNDSFNRALNYVNGSVATIMFLNMRSAALQTISAANYVNWTDNNPVAIGKVIAENPAEFIRVAKKIWSSDALKDRRSGLRINVEEAEMAKAINQGGRTNLQGLWDTMVKVGFKPTQMADSFAIVTGGTPFYMNRMKTYEKQGLSKSEAENKAFEDFLDVTQEGQQSSQMDRVSNIQTGLMGRLVFSFNNTPFQMSRIQKKAALDLVNRRGSDRANASRLAYYAFMQSTLFYGLQQGFYATLMSDDDDKLSEKQQEEKYKDFEKRVDRLGKSVFQGILTGSGMYGKGIVTLYNTVDKAIQQYDKGYQGKDFFPILNEFLSFSPTLGSKASRLGRNWNSLIYTDFTKKGREIRNTYNTFDPRNPNAKAYLSMFGTLTNIPLDRIVTKMENIQGVLDDQSSGWEKVAMTLGTPKYQLQTKEQNEADRQARIDKFYKENTPKGDRDFNAISDLNKKEQLKFMTDLDIGGEEYFKIKNNEEKRINFIIRKGLEKGIDLEVEAEKYIIKKPERSAEYKELVKLTKKQQLELMTILNIGDEYFKLKDGKEEDRVNWILKKQKENSNNNKQNSLK